MFIKRVIAKIIKDSRGEKTIEVSVNNGEWASSPSGKSTGKYETKPYHKNGLNFNLDFLNSWDERISIRCFDDLNIVERFIKQKLKLKNVKDFGANALFAFESAILKTLAKEEKIELWQIINHKAKKFPRPIGNVCGGGLHTVGKIKPIFQEFLIIPKYKSFAKNVRIMKKIYRDIGKILKSDKINDEGAWVTPLNDEEVLKIIHKYNELVNIGIDFAASSFYKKNFYYYGKLKINKKSHIENIISLINNYDIFYSEDPCNEDDFLGFAEIKKRCLKSLIVGDDLTATHLERTIKAIKSNSICAVIIKPNQNGSLLEVKAVIDICKKHKIKTIMSHRSGETSDSALADYSFAFQTDFIKCGIATKWRESKLRRMIEIEKSLN